MSKQTVSKQTMSDLIVVRRFTLNRLEWEDEFTYVTKIGTYDIDFTAFIDRAKKLTKLEADEAVTRLSLMYPQPDYEIHTFLASELGL